MKGTTNMAQHGSDSSSSTDFETSVVLSCSESSYEIEDSGSERGGSPDQFAEPEEARGNNPYRYEPYASDAEAEEGHDESGRLSDNNDGEPAPVDLGRLNNVEWCQCSKCTYVHLENPEECVCCREVERVLEKNEGQPGDCITQHPAFLTVCLDSDVLDVAYSHYKQQYGQVNKSQNERHRYTAYRQFVRWIWDFLGKKIRVPLPACVVDRVRQTYPSPQYTGFLDVVNKK